MSENKENIIQFPQNADKFFARRNVKGELERFLVGRYVIVRSKGGKHDIRYVEPDLKGREAELFETGGDRVVEIREINSGMNFDLLIQRRNELNDSR